MYPLCDIGGGKDPLIKCAFKAKDNSMGLKWFKSPTVGAINVVLILFDIKISHPQWYISLLVLAGVENHIRHEILKVFIRMTFKYKNSRPRAGYKRGSLSILLWRHIGWKYRRFVCWKKVHFFFNLLIVTLVVTESVTFQVSFFLLKFYREK